MRDAFARLRSMASSSSNGANGGDDEEASVLLPDSSSSSATLASSSSAAGGGGAQLRGGGASGAGQQLQQPQQQQRLPVSTVGSNNIAAAAAKGGLLASAFPAAPPQEKPSPSSFLPPPLSPARVSSVAASSLVGSVAAFFGKPFSSPSSSSSSWSSPRRRQTKASAPSPSRLSSSLLSRDSVLTLLVVAAWYAANTGILLMNRALLSNFGFRRPLLLTLLHMSACALLGRACEPWEESLEGRSLPPPSSSLLDDRVSEKEAASAAAQPPPAPPSAALSSSSNSSNSSSPAGGGPAKAKVAVLAATFCAAVVLGNVSLRFIPVSFAQAIGSTTPAFTAALAFALLGAREPLAVYATLLPVVGGVVLATGFEPSFDALGFGTAVAATAARSLKAVLQGALLSSDPSSRDRVVGSMALLRLMAPVAAAMLLPATVLLEPGGFAATAAACRRSAGFAAFLLANAALSYVVNLTNFVVTKRTSPLTLHVLGNAKGVFATVVSVAVFKNPVSGVGALGYLSAVAGTLLYGFLKSAKKRQQLQQQQLGRSERREESGIAKEWNDASVAKVGAFHGLSASNVDGAIRIKAVAA